MSAPSAPHGPDLVVVQLDDDLPTQGEGSKGGGAAELQQQEQDPISMSQTVAGLLETGNKPVKSTLRGFKVAGKARGGREVREGGGWEGMKGVKH